MAIKDGRTYGRTSTEIISVDPRMISLRLLDGSYLGCKLNLSEDGKKRDLAPGEQPLEYSQEVLSLIAQEKTWNPRIEYGDIEDLKQRIKAVRRIKEPLELIADGGYLGLKKGHRRHYALWLLRQEGTIIEDVPAIIIKVGNGLSIEDLELDFWQDNTAKNFTYYEKSNYIKRFLDRGFTKEEFAQKVGTKVQEIDMILTIAGQPEIVRKLIDTGAIAPTTLKLAVNEARRLDWTEKELSDVLQQVVAESHDLGKGKATQEQVLDAIENKQAEKAKKVGVTPPAPRKGKQTKIKAKAFDDLISQARQVKKDRNTVTVEIPADLWQEYQDILVEMRDKNGQ
jgi:hypothetical protein